MNSQSVTTRRSAGRPADRQNHILKSMREQIVTGRIAPGERLPTREAMARTYGAGSHTVQRALNKLKLEGFIESNERGTRVSLQPPHLNRYAFVFPGLPNDGASWVRFWTALEQEALALKVAPGAEVAFYYDVCGDQRTPDYQALLADVLSQSVAGVIFVTYPHRLVGTPILSEPGIPRVSISSPLASATMPVVSLDMGSFYRKAVAELQARGCRRIASLNAPGVEVSIDLSQYADDPSAFVNHSYWNLSGHLLQPETSVGLMQLLFQGPPESRPDGLIIGDDNFVQHATQGIATAGVKVPEELQIIAHSNFPWAPEGDLPVTHLGFDAREILRMAIGHINALRQGRELPPVTVIDASFEKEMAL